MNIFLIAIKNVKKNFSFYLLYLVSVSLVITIFFSFISFSGNDVILEKISTDGRVETMCRTISIFLMLFVIFYMTYSNGFFLRRRTKELGIYAFLGYGKSKILSLLLFENILICSLALLIGLLGGALMHQGIVFGITNLLDLSIDLSKIPLFNHNAIIKTSTFIFWVILLLGVSNGRFLFKATLMNLIRYEKAPEKNLKFRKTPAVLGLLMTLMGYLLALDVLRGSSSLWITLGLYPMGLLTMLLVIFGTILLITSFFPYLMEKSKKNKKAFYTEIKIITTPHFIYRVRSNAKTLIILTLLSAGTLTISSVMALTLYYPIAAVSRIIPSEIEFRLEEDQLEAVQNILNSYSSNQEITFSKTDIFKITSISKDLPTEYRLGTAKGDADNERILREEGFECISFSSYKALLEAQGKKALSSKLLPLDSNDCILVKYEAIPDPRNEKGEIYPLLVGDQILLLTLRETTLNNTISFANSIGTLIVSDIVYEKIKTANLPFVSVFSINGNAIKNNEKLYQELGDFLNDSPYFQGYSHRIKDLFSMNSSTFLLIGFLVILFFIATGSILYFNNISSIIDSKPDYDILIKMGFTHKSIKKIIKKQVLPFYSIPFFLGLLNSIFATLIYKSLLMQNLLGDSFSEYLPVLIAISLTAVIYFAYYRLTVYTGYKAVR